jgi:hypothetical protein
MMAGLEFLAQALGLLSAVVVVVRAEPVLNRIVLHAPDERHRVPIAALRLIAGAMAALTLGGVGLILYIVGGYIPGVVDLLFAGGAAALLVCERRLRILCPVAPRRRATP